MLKDSNRSLVPPRGHARRRWVSGATWGRAVAAGLTVLATLLVAPRPAAAATEVRSAREPIMVSLELGGIGGSIAAPDDARPALVERCARRVVEQVRPGRLVTLRLADLSLRYENLSTRDRDAARAAAPPEAEPAAWYETTLAALLAAVLDGVRETEPAALAIYGLPGEGGAAASNARYAPVLDRIQAFLTPRSFIAAGSAQSQEQALRAGLAESFRLHGGRPIFFRSNGAWKVAVDTDAQPPSIADGLTQAKVRALLAEWGRPNSPWDLDRSGSVTSTDLILLLADPARYDVPHDASTVARFVDPPPRYLRGSCPSLVLELLADAPADASVVFQVWSDTSGAFELPYADHSAPFAYPGTNLDRITPGTGEVQALVRNARDQVLAVVRHSAVFAVPDPSPGDEEPPVMGGDPVTPDRGRTEPSEPASDSAGPTDPPGDNPDSPSGPDGDDDEPGDEDDPSGDPAAPRPSPRITVLTPVTGMAPLTVHVHALDSDLGIGGALTGRYEWDFGDAEGRFSALEGWNAAHVYDRPGTYTLTLRLTNHRGGTATATQPVTVLPDTRARVYVSAAGNDAGLGASPASPVRTFARAMQLVNNATAILFHCGETFNVSSGAVLNRRDCVIGSYGTGNRPKLRWTGPTGYSSILGTHDSSRNVIIENLQFTSQYGGNESRILVDALNLDGQNITVRGCVFDEVATAINTERDPRGVLTLDNRAEDLRAYYLWGEGADHVHLGNTVHGSLHEHNVRLADAERVLIAHNDLACHPKRTIWAMLGRHAWIGRNRLREGRLTIGPNFAVGSPAERFRDVVIDGNLIEYTGAESAVEIEPGAERLSLRNNVIRSEASAIEISSFDDRMTRGCRDVRILNNTAVNTGRSGRFLDCGSGVAEVLVANNLYIAPELETGSYRTAVIFVLARDLGAFTTIRDNLWPVPRRFAWVPEAYHYVWDQWSSAGGYQTPEQWAQRPQTARDEYERLALDEAFRPPAGSAADGHARPAAGVYTDFTGAPRPDEGPWTAGAVQLEPRP
jgi:PKD repeat protein